MNDQRCLLVDVYQTPWGDWAWAAAGRISDGYATELAATRDAAEYLASVLAGQGDA